VGTMGAMAPSRRETRPSTARLIDKIRPPADILLAIPPVASVAGCEARELAGLSDLNGQVVGVHHDDGFWNCPRPSVMTDGNWHAATGPLRSCLKNVG
jgi:hypothetical protein